MSQSKTLYRLQQLDLDLDTRRSRIREITAVLEQDTELRQAQQAVDAIQKKLRPAETHAADLNLELQTVSTQSTQLSTRLYGGTVSNPKELEDIQDKIAERKRRHAHLENELLETMITIEELQESLVKAQKRLHIVEAERATEHKSLTTETKRLKQEIKALKADRQAAADQVSAENMDLYDTLRARKQRIAVAALDGDMCSVCRVGQTSNIVQQVRQDQNLIMCSSCGRILVAY